MRTTRLPYMYLMLLGMLFGTFLSLSSLHWMGMWAGMEISLICFLSLAVGGQKASVEASVKYYLFQAVGSAWFVLASLLAYTLTFNWDSSNSHSLNILVLAGLCVKLGVAPFHYWLPSVMAGLTWFSSYLLTTLQKVAPLFVMTSAIQDTFAPVLMLIGVISAITGALGGLSATLVRSLLAYSSIGHMGWISCILAHNSELVYLYLSTYVVLNSLLFFSLSVGSMHKMKSLSDMPSSLLAWCSMITLLSLAGLPPLLGFVPKLLGLIVICTGPYWHYMVLLLLSSVLSLSYYLNLCFSLFLSINMQFKPLYKEPIGWLVLPLSLVINMSGLAMVSSIT